MDMKEIVITNVWGPNNRGDAALVEALVTDIRKVLHDVPHRISGIATHWEMQREQTPDVEWLGALIYSSYENIILRRIERLVRTAAMIPYILLGDLLLTRMLLSRRQRMVCDLFKRADLVMTAPGGFIFDAHWNVISMLLEIIVPKMFVKKFCCRHRASGRSGPKS
jgi:colanic acid/amylovoran biosynthesis protein